MNLIFYVKTRLLRFWNWFHWKKERCSQKWNIKCIGIVGKSLWRPKKSLEYLSSIEDASNSQSYLEIIIFSFKCYEPTTSAANPFAGLLKTFEIVTNYSGRINCAIHIITAHNFCIEHDHSEPKCLLDRN